MIAPCEVRLVPLFWELQIQAEEEILAVTKENNALMLLGKEKVKLTFVS